MKTEQESIEQYEKEVSSAIDWFLSDDYGKNCRNESSYFYCTPPMIVAKLLIKYSRYKNVSAIEVIKNRVDELNYEAEYFHVSDFELRKIKAKIDAYNDTIKILQP